MPFTTHDPIDPAGLNLSAEFERWAPVALRKVVDLMLHAPHERTQLHAAQVIFEYTARKPSSRLDVRMTHDFGGTVNAALERRRMLLLQGRTRVDSAESENSGTAKVVPELAAEDIAAADTFDPSASQIAHNPHNEPVAIVAVPPSVAHEAVGLGKTTEREERAEPEEAAD